MTPVRVLRRAKNHARREDVRRSNSMAKKQAARIALKKTAGKKASSPRAAKGAKSVAAPKVAGKFVYLFGRKTDGNGTMKPLLGGKGANLAEMCRIGLPVPPGFTITTEVCTYYYA